MSATPEPRPESPSAATASPARPARSLPARLALGLGLSTLALALAAGVAELGLRVLAPQPISWLSIYAEDEVLPYCLAPGVSQHVATGETDWRVYVDERGYRAPAPGARPPESGPYLLGLGDSFAFGHGTDHEQSLYGILDAALADVTVRNASVPGYGPEQYRMVLESHLAAPDADRLAGVLLTSFLGNDFHDTLWNKERPITDGALGATAGRRYWIKKSSHLYRFLSARAHALGFGRGESDLHLNAELLTLDVWRNGRLAEALEIYARELRAVRELCRAADVPLFVILLPARATVDDELCATSIASAGLEDHAWERDLPTRKAAAVCGKLSIPYFETGELLADLPRPLYLRFDGHFQPATTHAIANALVQRFLPGGRGEL